MAKKIFILLFLSFFGCVFSAFAPTPAPAFTVEAGSEFRPTPTIRRESVGTHTEKTLRDLSRRVSTDTPPQYDLGCAFNGSENTLNISGEITFTNNYHKETNSLYFHIYPNRVYNKEEKNFLTRFAGYFKINPFPGGFESGQLTIEDLSLVKGNSFEGLTYEIEGDDKTILKVNLPAALNYKDSVKIKINCTVKIPHAYGRFGWHSENNNEIVTLHRFYPILCMFNEDGWHTYPNYLYHQPFFSEASLYKVKVSLPDGFFLAHSGKEIQKTQTSGREIIDIDSELPIRDFSLAISSAYKLISKEVNGIKINSFYLKGDEFYAQKALQFAAELMQYYTKFFGEYPYKEFSIAPSFLGSGGYETSNMIFIDTRVYKLPKFLTRYFEYLIVHETGHQWFFNIVGSDEFKETWLDEAFNSYWLMRYFEDKYGPNAKVMDLPRYLDWFIPNIEFKKARTSRYMYLEKNGWDSPVLGKLSSFRQPENIFAFAYGKGSSVVAMLDYLVGDEAFLKIMQEYFKEFKFKNSSVSAFKEICEKETGKDLSWFFDDWLKATKACDFSIKKLTKDKLVIENKGQIQMPLEAVVYFEDGTSKEFLWDAKSKEEEFILLRITNENNNECFVEYSRQNNSPKPISASIIAKAKENSFTSKKIKKVELDPQKRLLETDRVNNIAYAKNTEKNIDIKIVPLYLFLYEIPVFLEDDAYSLVAGPDLSSNGIGLKASLQRPYDNIMYGLTNYDISENQINSVLGYQIKHLLNSPLILGAEVFDKNDLADDIEDLQGGKVYLRKELWPAGYGFTQINDHATLYFLHNRKFEGLSAVDSAEDVENLLYRKHKESIFGLQFNFDRSGPYPDPNIGWKLSLNQEVGGHFVDGDEAFWRFSSEFSKYINVFDNQRLALRFKGGLGGPSDKALFQLGSDEGLRGWERKEIEGANMLLASVEYRVDVLKGLNIRLLDNVINFSGLGLVGFFDAGKGWFANFSEADFKEDIGIGFRVPVDIAGFLEKVILRIDIAQPLGERKKDPRLWLAINHAF